MGKHGIDTGPDWTGQQVLLASRKCEGSDLAASTTSMRR